MRVIAGSAKGTRLYGAKGLRVRPMIDRVKESVFAIIGESVAGERVLDLFAGVGSLGIEALSRGARHADFIEVDRATAAAIERNLVRTHLEDRGNVIKGRLPGALNRLVGTVPAGEGSAAAPDGPKDEAAPGERPAPDSVGGPYGLIFIDPPFRIEAHLLAEVFRFVSGRGMLRAGGRAVYRHSPRSGYEPPGDEWVLAERRDYGDSVVSIYQLRADHGGRQDDHGDLSGHFRSGDQRPPRRHTQGRETL